MPRPDSDERVSLSHLDLPLAGQSRPELTSHAGLSLLAQVTEALGSTLDAEEGVQRLVRLVVPRLADWSIVSLFETPVGSSHDGDGAYQLRDLAVVHRDRDKQAHVEAYATARAEAMRLDAPVWQAVASLRPQMLGDGSDTEANIESFITTVVDDSPARLMLRALRPGAALVLPLTARGRLRGMVSLYRDAGTGSWSDDEVEVAREVADRAGMALDNARLYAERRNTSLVLQQAMLTDLPAPDHLELRARYWPAADGEQVGGDWYDAVLLPSGATGLAVGDVTGHDVKAAARMGQVRTMLRVLAWEHNEPASAVVTRLDQAIAGLNVDTLATLIYATIEQEHDEREQGLRRLHWTNAGHLPPLLLHRDGRVDVLHGETDLQVGKARADLLIGLVPDTARRDFEVLLSPGSTLLLFTDGLVERRGEDISVGMSRLVSALSRRVDLPLDDLLDQVLQDVVAGERADDIAVLAVRMHPEDRPRPAEAGPGQLQPRYDAFA